MLFFIFDVFFKTWISDVFRNVLATTLDAQGKFVEAAVLKRQTLDVQRRLLGSLHPDTLTSASNLAATLHAQAEIL